MREFFISILMFLFLNPGVSYAGTHVFRGSKCQFTLTNLSNGELKSVESSPFSAVCTFPDSDSGFRDWNCTFVAPGTESVSKIMKFGGSKKGSTFYLTDLNGAEIIRFSDSRFISDTTVDLPDSGLLGHKQCVGVSEYK
jgi:hypothetical protein